jgi:hypothetical protein
MAPETGEPHRLRQVTMDVAGEVHHRRALRQGEGFLEVWRPARLFGIDRSPISSLGPRGGW